MVVNQQKKIPLVKSTKSFKIIVPREMENKIRHLCSVVHDVEWSGTLFYTCKGTIENDDFEVTCVDLFVMDIGTGGSTEYKESPDILSYRIEHDLLREDVMEGLIHSHNNMATFFSSTDQDTLIKEGTNSNHFVSLIVNNEGTYTAGLTRRVVTEVKASAKIKYVTNKYYNSYNDKTVTLTKDDVRYEDKEETKRDEIIEWFSLDVTVDRSPHSFREIDERLSEIRKSKNTKSYKPSYTVGNYYQKKKTESVQKSLWDDYFDDGYYGYSEDYWPTSIEKKKEPKATADFTEDEIPLYLAETFDSELIEDIAVQLLTGSIIVNKNAIDINKWVKNMDAIYKKRFGDIDGPHLAEWIDSMLEFLLFNTEDKALLDRLKTHYEGTFNTSDTAEVCAYYLSQYLENLPDSEVKEIILDRLFKYLPYDAKDI